MSIEAVSNNGWVCTKCHARLPAATDALNHRCGTVVVPLSAVLAALEKALPCEENNYRELWCDKLKGVKGDDSPLCPNCRARKAVMEEIGK